MTEPEVLEALAIRDHGGSLRRAAAIFPDAPQPWLDLSTGINPHAYPFGAVSASAFARLPEEESIRELEAVAGAAYGVASGGHVVAAPGTQILLPLVMRLRATGRTTILSPTYAEYRRAAAIVGHAVVETQEFDALASADIAVVVNPNNPDGRVHGVADLLRLRAELAARGGLLVVDEAFMDVGPRDGSLAPFVSLGGLVVLRSFGKFFGLAGVRLGFALGSGEIVRGLRDSLGPWAVSGPGLEVGTKALADLPWQDAMRSRLSAELAQLDLVFRAAGVAVTGGTPLYRFVDDANAAGIFRALGSDGILVRKFDRDPRTLRIGLPPGRADFERLSQALRKL